MKIVTTSPETPLKDACAKGDDAALDAVLAGITPAELNRIDVRNQSPAWLNAFCRTPSWPTQHLTEQEAIARLPKVLDKLVRAGADLSLMKDDPDFGLNGAGVDFGGPYAAVVSTRMRVEHERRELRAAADDARRPAVPSLDELAARIDARAAGNEPTAPTPAPSARRRL